MLQIKNVNLNVGNTALLSNINLTLEQGKNYGVLGPNGAGKTTLFKSMLGLTDFSGEILSDGQPVSRACLKIKNCTKHLFLSPFYSIIKKKGCSLC